MAIAAMFGCCWAACALTLATDLPAVRVRVLGDRVNLRARDSDSVEVVGQAMEGQELTALEGLDGAWVRVVPPDDISLWIYGELVRDGVVVVDRAQIRGGPGLQYKNVGVLARGAVVEVRGELGEWLKIRPPPSASLWVSRAYVEPLALPADPPPANPPPVAVPADDPALETDAPAVALTAQPPADPPAPELPLPVPSAADAVRAGAPHSLPSAALGWPSELQGEPPDTLRPQGGPARFSGQLLRAGASVAPRAADYLLVQRDNRGRPVTLCHLVGMDDQLGALVGSTVAVRGRTWYIGGIPQPAVQPERIVRME